MCAPSSRQVAWTVSLAPGKWWPSFWAPSAVARFSRSRFLTRKETPVPPLCNATLSLDSAPSPETGLVVLGIPGPGNAVTLN